MSNLTDIELATLNGVLKDYCELNYGNATKQLVAKELNPVNFVGLMNELKTIEGIRLKLNTPNQGEMNDIVSKLSSKVGGTIYDYLHECNSNNWSFYTDKELEIVYKFLVDFDNYIETS